MKPWLLLTATNGAPDSRSDQHSQPAHCRCVAVCTEQPPTAFPPPHTLVMSSADEVSSLRAKVAELEGKLAAAEAAAAASSSTGTGVVRTKIDKLSSVVVDTNPYSRLMALKAMVRGQGTPRRFESRPLHAAPQHSLCMLRFRPLLPCCCACTVNRASCRTTSRSEMCRLRSSAVAVWAALRPRC